MKKPIADKANIQRVASTLITLNGSTTTLEVKEQLRQEDFWAEQSTVSAVLQQIAKDENYTVSVDSTSGKTFNRYSIGAPVQQSQQSQTQPASPASPTFVNGIINIISKLFGFVVTGTDKFEDLGIDSQAALQLVIDETATEFNFNASQFIGTDFEPAAIIVWRDKTIDDFASLVDTLTVPAQTTIPVATTTTTTTPPHTPVAPSKQRKPRQRATAKPLFIVPDNTDNRAIRAGYKRTDWVVSTSTTERCIYDGTETRDQVRSAYATAYNVKIQRVRSRRVENIDKP